ncbi:MAG: cation:proton antiporter [Paludibacter sp.]|jgi:Kef-type K+ transport system membrane component KefB|nr:cation:proton antiporter [Paludibacter sp.]
MTLLLINELSLPLQHPVLKFMVILVIILFAPIIFNRIKIPHILGLIIAGAIIGPFGINLLQRDGSIILSGTAGLLYIMFLAGLEIDLGDLKKNSKKSIVFGLLTFAIPMLFGILAGIFLMNFSMPTSILIGSMFASHTLITYPIVTRLDVVKNRAVVITVGGTIITVTLGLLVLAVIIGMQTGEVNSYFWTRLSVSILIFSAIVLLLFPIVGRWFFKKFSDSVSQYIFVLVMVFLGAVLAQAAGIESIIGAFLAGLSLNRLIPVTSPLMNRISFVGNAIFIPFFLISVGMLIDYRAFFNDLHTLYVAVILSITATFSKFIPAVLTRRLYKFTPDEGNMIFGLSNAQAAATLAAVLVGYNVVTGYASDGSPIRLLNESVLNGTIIMILVTCTIASIVTQKAAVNISLSETANPDPQDRDTSEQILIPVKYAETIDELINLSSLLKSKSNLDGLYALNVINNSTSGEKDLKKAQELLDKAVKSASSVDIRLNKLLRYDVNVVNAITSVVREQSISDLVVSLHTKKGITDSFLGKLTEGILTKNNVTTFVYKASQPISTIKRHILVIPRNAELEIGFPFWLLKVWNIARNSGAILEIYGQEKTIGLIQEVHAKHPVEAQFKIFDDWDDFLILSREIRDDDNLIIIMAREKSLSFHNSMERIPHYLRKYFENQSFILIFPMQTGVLSDENDTFTNPSMLEPIGKLDEIGKTIARIFKRK